MGSDVLVRVVIPGVVVFGMAVVGLDLTLEDFRRVTRHRRRVGVGVLGPVLVLPPLAMTLGHGLAPPPAVAEGMLLVVACPTAILSNLCTDRALRAAPEERPRSKGAEGVTGVPSPVRATGVSLHIRAPWATETITNVA